MTAFVHKPMFFKETKKKYRIYNHFSSQNRERKITNVRFGRIFFLRKRTLRNVMQNLFLFKFQLEYNIFQTDEEISVVSKRD